MDGHFEDFDGRVAVITGSGSGIGAALARAAASVGMKVVLADIDEARLEETRASLEAAGAEVLAVPTDVRDAAAVDRLSDAAYDHFGSVELLVNNAGIESVGRIWEMSPDNWGRVQQVNAGGAFHGIRSFVPRMGMNPLPTFVVNIASVAAVASGTMNSAYYASKHATLAMTECLYLEAQSAFPRMSVSVVCPAAVTTEIFEDALVDGEVSPTSASAETLQTMRGHLSEDGITADAAAQLILEGAALRDFWIATHPDRFGEIITRRADMLRAMAAPVGNVATELRGRQVH